MASSSSSYVPNGGWTYDVFLSFRGDARHTFADHLHRSLFQNGIHVFKDDEMLRREKLISSELPKAIEESRFAVVVFSENYAMSSWCLDELAKIMDCHDQMGQEVIPVFYHVDPSDVRRQERAFASAFQQYEEKFREEPDKVNKWREALAAAAELSGWVVSQFNRDESAIIKKIVQSIVDRIQPSINNLIGIKPRTNELESLLDLEATQEVRIVGIWGMGGIGKTTIAQALFRRISYKFEGSSFVEVGKENISSKRGICALQEKILKDVVATHHESNIMDPDDGAELIQTRVCNKKVLLVLDDVDDVKQLEFLAATHEWFGEGSRIIITTSDKHLLSNTNANFEPALLLKEEAFELFSRHAFRKNSPPEGFEELSYRAIRYTGYLPLALKVLGSFFRGRPADVWESALNRLVEAPDKKIYETLKISFDGLEDYEQKIFLHVACLFKGVNRARVTRILDSFGFHAGVGIYVLIEKSLITDSDERLVVHDLLQEMALRIVRESCPNSMLWKHEVIHDFIRKNTKLEAIEAIVDPHCYGWTWQGDFLERLENTSGQIHSADVFKNMKNLRLLDIKGPFTYHEPTFLPDELRWLKWDLYPFSSFPAVASMHKLAGIELSNGSIEHLWKGYKFLPNLKFIHLECLYCIETSPDVSGAPNVERLILSDCMELVEVHESLGTLKKLVYLKVSRCYKLRCLPSLIDMPSLETVDLSDFIGLEKFPEVSSGNEKLSNIHLNGCSRLKVIPSSICELKYLKSLHLQDCRMLQILPEELGNMAKLEELQLGFMKLMFFPEEPEFINFHALTKLCCLRKLDLSRRSIGEKDFPSNFHEFSSLEELDLSGNCKLVHLPASISHLSRLKQLKLNGCLQLQNIHGLPSRIQVIKACYCGALDEIEDLTEVHVWLYKIWLPGCKRLPKNQESERYLNKMLQQSFLKKCAVDHVSSICIPGSKIPSWFEEHQHGGEITLKLPPPNCHKDIMGFAVCGVFQGTREQFDPIRFRVELNGTSIQEECEDYYRYASAVSRKESIWIVYIPFSLFQQHRHDKFGGEDWSRFVEGNLMISIPEPRDNHVRMIISTVHFEKIVRCGAHLLYK